MKEAESEEPFQPFKSYLIIVIENLSIFFVSRIQVATLRLTTQCTMTVEKLGHNVEKMYIC